MCVFRFQQRFVWKLKTLRSERNNAGVILQHEPSTNERAVPKQIKNLVGMRKKKRRMEWKQTWKTILKSRKHQWNKEISMHHPALAFSEKKTCQLKQFISNSKRQISHSDLRKQQQQLQTTTTTTKTTTKPPDTIREKKTCRCLKMTKQEQLWQSVTAH